MLFSYYVLAIVLCKQVFLSALLIFAANGIGE